MNVIRVMGGLGNQLFQYAFGRVQKENGIKVYYDISWYTRHANLQWPRPFRLDRFNVDMKYSTQGGMNVIHDPMNSVRMELLTQDNFYYHGYWQYVDYYRDILPILQKEFCVKKEFYTDDFLKYCEMICSDESVSVHVRRGDYVDRPGFDTLSFSHYYHALAEMKGNIFVFSDDIEWCNRYFNNDYFGRPVTIIHLDDFLDFELMKCCSHNIISHSTFSWWAAFLNANPNKKVIAPTHWTVMKDHRPTHDINIHYPKEWIKI